jgi:bromodomain-containing protein 8
VPKKNPFANQIQPVHELISFHRYGELFTSPILESQVPGYHSLIFKPTDLKTIWKQVKEEVITNGIVFHREIARMFANAIMFNAEDCMSP